MYIHVTYTVYVYNCVYSKILYWYPSIPAHLCKMFTLSICCQQLLELCVRVLEIVWAVYSTPAMCCVHTNNKNCKKKVSYNSALWPYTHTTQCTFHVKRKPSLINYFFMSITDTSLCIICLLSSSDGTIFSLTTDEKLNNQHGLKGCTVNNHTTELLCTTCMDSNS